MYRFFNPHKKGTATSVGDCVKRAIVATTGMDYADVGRKLNAYKKVTGAKTFNGEKNPHHYVEDILEGRMIALKKKMSAKDFAKRHPRGRYILDMDGHWSSCIDGDIYDSWDCSDELVNFAYEINTHGFNGVELKKQVFKYCCTSEAISKTETRVRIYDGNGNFAERIIPSALVEGYVLCLKHSNYQHIAL